MTEDQKIAALKEAELARVVATRIEGGEVALVQGVPTMLRTLAMLVERAAGYPSTVEASACAEEHKSVEPSR